MEKTYGVVLFQEQVIAIAGFTPGEADRLRRVMTHARSRTEIAEIGRFYETFGGRGADTSERTVPPDRPLYRIV